MFKVLAFGATNVGRERKNNEDAYRVEADIGLYVVCDGMGGHASGEIASQITADAMVRFIAQDRTQPGFRWPAEVLHQQAEEARALDAAVRIANVEVYASAGSNPMHKGMGTTVAGILAGPARLGLVHVGDSRICRLRGEVYEQLTDDHSLLNHYMRTRPMSAQQIRQFAGKNVIVRAVGLRDVVEPDVQLQDYRAGDLYLLCSDGLTDMVEDDAIAETLRRHRDDLEAAGNCLIEQALEGGGKDNVTLLLLHVVTDDEAALVAGRSTDPMKLSLEDTSPGFDIRKDGLEEETLPEFAIGQPGSERRFSKTQRITHSDVTPAPGSALDAITSPNPNKAAQPPALESAFASTALATPHPFHDTRHLPRFVVTVDAIVDRSLDTDPLMPRTSHGLSHVPAHSILDASTEPARTRGRPGLVNGPTLTGIPVVGRVTDVPNFDESRENTERLIPARLEEIRAEVQRERQLMRTTTMDGPVARGQSSGGPSTDGFGRPLSVDDTRTSLPTYDSWAPLVVAPPPGTPVAVPADAAAPALEPDTKPES